MIFKLSCYTNENNFNKLKNDGINGGKGPGKSLKRELGVLSVCTIKDKHMHYFIAVTYIHSVWDLRHGP